MQFTASIAALVGLATLAAATPTPWGSSGSTGTDLCCSSTGTPATDATITTLLGLLGVVLSDIDVLVGVGCSPITVIGVGPGACSTTTVSCTSTQANGLVGIGCVPITL
ncbi:fungal hydrophobin [Obba rivulosa]|uniref:Hydrophobin n=1 Tax=Obba rivulosa TaxID=1052685 RepID=A0A8E2AV65_9APHY|nr:fungal hydrophobin [Obba rivulosa]